jgi:group I intron endonuclease
MVGYSMRTDAGVYEIINTVNGKRYIGGSVSVTSRLQQHIRKLVGQTHTNHHLQSAWNKYGPGSFEFNPLFLCDRSMVLVYEQMCLDAMKPEYNVVYNAAAPNKGRVFSEEVRAKIAKAGIGRITSDETRRKLSKALRGRKLSAEVIKKHAIAVTGKHPSQEARQRMSEAGKGRKFSEEHKARIGAKTKARWNSEEYRQRLSQSLMGRVHS